MWNHQGDNLLCPVSMFPRSTHPIVYCLAPSHRDEALRQSLMVHFISINSHGSRSLNGQLTNKGVGKKLLNYVLGKYSIFKLTYEMCPTHHILNAEFFI